MKNKTYLIALACGVLTLGFGATAHAQTILNGDFSDDASAFSNYYGIIGADGNPSSIPHWTSTEVDGAIGIEGADNGLTTFGPENGSPSGVDYVFIYHAGYVTQDLTFKADTTYTLTLDVASRATNGYAVIAAPYYIIDDGDSITPTPDSSVGGMSPSLGASNFPDAVTGSFQQETITFTTTTGGAGYITLGNNYGGTPGGFDDTAEFTDVSLSGVVNPSVPEPSTWVLSLLGVLGLAFVLRRRSNNS